jgi:iron(III) transport system permease protein
VTLTTAPATPRQRRSRAGTTRPPWPLVVLGAVIAMGALVPIGYIAWYAVDLGPAATWDLLARPRVGELMRNTLALLVGVVALSTVLGTATAWVVESTDLPGKIWWHAALVAPLAVPAFVNSYAWVSTTSAIQSYTGAVLVVSLSYYPLVYLPVVATMRGIDPALVESAQALGLSRWEAFRRVTLPLLRTAIAGGALLVGLHTLAEFGALQMLRFPTFTTAIYDQYRSAFNSAPGTVLAAVLVLGCLVLLGLDVLVRGRGRVSRVGAGTARDAAPVDLGRSALPVLAGLTGLVVLALGVPFFALVRWLVIGSSREFPVAEVAHAAVSTMSLAALAAAVTAVLAVPVCWLVVRHPSPVSLVVERATYTAHALPGIVVALALVAVSIRVVPALYQTLPVLLFAYATLFLPRAMVSVRASLEQAPPVLTDVARSLGLHPLQAMLRVTLPLLRPGLGAGAALVFLAVSTELTATLLLAPTGTTTLATEFWSASSSARYAAAAPYALLLVAVSVPATIFLGMQARRGLVRGGEA